MVCHLSKPLFKSSEKTKLLFDFSSNDKSQTLLALKTLYMFDQFSSVNTYFLWIKYQHNDLFEFKNNLK